MCGSSGRSPPSWALLKTHLLLVFFRWPPACNNEMKVGIWTKARLLRCISVTSSPLLAHTIGPEFVVVAVDAIAGFDAGLDCIEQVDTHVCPICFVSETVSSIFDGFTGRSAFAFGTADVVAGFVADADPRDIIIFGAHLFCGSFSQLFSAFRSDCNAIHTSTRTCTAMVRERASSDTPA